MNESGMPLRDAIAAADEAATQLTHWNGEHENAERALAELQASAGALVLADPAAAETRAQEIAVARARVEVAAGTTVEASGRALDAQRAALSARAVELRAEAAQVAQQAADHRVTTDKLRAALSEHEGGATVHVRDPWTESARRPGDPSYPMPTSRILSNKAAALTSEAAQFEQRAGEGPPAVAGYVEALRRKLAQPSPA